VDKHDQSPAIDPVDLLSEHYKMPEIRDSFRSDLLEKSCGIVAARRRLPVFRWAASLAGVAAVFALFVLSWLFFFPARTDQRSASAPRIDAPVTKGATNGYSSPGVGHKEEKQSNPAPGPKSSSAPRRSVLVSRPLPEPVPDERKPAPKAADTPTVRLPARMHSAHTAGLPSPSPKWELREADSWEMRSADSWEMRSGSGTAEETRAVVATVDEQGNQDVIVVVPPPANTTAPPDRRDLTASVVPETRPSDERSMPRYPYGPEGSGGHVRPEEVVL